MTLYLVTGGAGFIGSAIVRRLVKQGERVRVADDFSTGSQHNLWEVMDRIELLEGDLAEPLFARQAVCGVDYVLHQAAIPSVQRSIDDPAASHRANVVATLNLLIAVREAEVKRFVYASSSSVYGHTGILPKTETLLINPISPYALTKFAGEKYCLLFHTLYGLPTVALRYFNVFGPRQNPRSLYSAVIPQFIAAALGGSRPRILGDGEQSRDFTYVENVVDANLRAAVTPGIEGEVFNIGTGEQHSLNELVKVLSSILGIELKPEYAAPRPGDVRHSLADIGRAHRLLGYRPAVGFQEGLRQTVAWFRQGRSPMHTYGESQGRPTYAVRQIRSRRRGPDATQRADAEPVFKRVG